MTGIKDKIKILELIDTFYPTVDGAINVTKHYCEELNKVADCKLAVPRAAKRDKYEDKESFEVIRCASVPAPEKYRSAFPDQDGKFVKKIKGEKFDILHTHSPFTLGRFAIRQARRQNIPVVATLHTQYHQDFERLLKSKPLVDFMINYIIKVFQNADSVWTVSERSCKILRDYGYYGKVEVIRNGTDYKYPDNPDELIEKVNSIHDLYGKKNVFLFVGRMAWYKNLKIILDALKIVKDKNPDFKMVFVGGGFDYEDVKSYAEESGLKDHCIFTGSVADKALIQGYYLRADLLLFPSTFDMAPVTGVEAAAHNLAAIMVKDSCSAELVQDGVNGFLADESAESFAAKILELMDKPDLVKAVGEQAGKTLYRSWDMVAKEVYQKYIEIIENKQKEIQILEELKKYSRVKRKERRLKRREKRLIKKKIKMIKKHPEDI